MRTRDWRALSDPLRYVHVYASGATKRPKTSVRAYRRLFMSPARAGSFNANFSPETLESFKSLCRDQSRQYTKVLERLAELYLGSQGGILENSEDPTLDSGSKLHSQQIASLNQAVKQLETVASMHREDNSELFQQIQDIDKRLRILEKFILER